MSLTPGVIIGLSKLVEKLADLGIAVVVTRSTHTLALEMTEAQYKGVAERIDNFLDNVYFEDGLLMLERSGKPIERRSWRMRRSRQKIRALKAEIKRLRKGVIN